MDATALEAYAEHYSFLTTDELLYLQRLKGKQWRRQQLQRKLIEDGKTLTKP